MILHLAVYINLQVYLLQVYKLENITLFFDGLSLKKNKTKNMSIDIHVFSDLRTKTRMILMHLKFELLCFWMFITILVPLAGVMHINILILITISKSSKKEVDSKADCFSLGKIMFSLCICKSNSCCLHAVINLNLKFHSTIICLFSM